MQSDRLTFRTFSSASGHSKPLHSHPYGQFTYVRSGLIGLKTETEVWINETQRLFWIPPGLSHASRARGPVDGWLVLIAPEYAQALLPQVCVLHASSLLVASLERLEQFPVNLKHIRSCGSSWRIHLAGRHRAGMRCGSRGSPRSARRPFVARL